MQELMQTGTGTFSVASKFNYDPFGKPLLFTGANERLTYIDKERDVESGLGDHGVRKYDYETGRFTTIDPLWAEYMGYNPYHYTRNNPICKIDGSGLADFKTETQTISDGVNDGLKFITTDKIISDNTFLQEGGIGPAYIDFSWVKYLSHFVGTKKIWQKVKKDIVKKIKKENKDGEDCAMIGVTANDKAIYKYGGPGTDMGGYVSCSDQLRQACEDIIKMGAKLFLTYYHSHGFGLNLEPTDPEDYNSVGEMWIQSGVTINQNKDVYIYDKDPAKQIILKFKDFNKFMNK